MMSATSLILQRSIAKLPCVDVGQPFCLDEVALVVHVARSDHVNDAL